MRLRPVPVLVACLSVSACGLEFTDPFPGESLRLSAQLEIHGADENQVGLTGHLLPGRTADGRARPVDHDTLETMGVRVGPEEIRSDGSRSYAGSWTLESEASDAGTFLRPPRPGSVAHDPPDLPFGPCTREGPRSLRAAAGDTLELTVACDHSPREPTQSIWRLVVRRADTGGQLLLLQSNNPPPPVIRLPTSWIHGRSEPELEVTVRLTHLYGWTSPTGDYRITLDANWSFRWTVEWDGNAEDLTRSGPRPRGSP